MRVTITAAMSCDSVAIQSATELNYKVKIIGEIKKGEGTGDTRKM